MSVYTRIQVLDASDEEFNHNVNLFTQGCLSEDEQDELEINEWIIENRPGKILDIDEEDFVTETEDEYGGWLIDLSKVPSNATHILVTRG